MRIGEEENKKGHKYIQLAKLIRSNIRSGIYQMHERIPSINETSEEYLVSRDTAEKAYKLLKQEGVLESIPGKGFFVADEHISNLLRVALLFNKLSNYKKATYDSFVNALHNKAIVDLHIYDYNIKVFDRIISNNIDNYDYFVIVPHFHPGSFGVEGIVKKIPKNKVLIIDKKISQLFDEYPIVYQDFEQDIFDAMQQGLDSLKKYKKVNLVFPKHRFFSKEIRMGFELFCRTYNFDYEIIDLISEREIEYQNAYVVIGDEDLVTFLKKANKKGYIVGNAVGVISYNETPEKELLAGGITTISTNHAKIGEQAAEMLLRGSKEIIKIPFKLELRNSL